MKLPANGSVLFTVKDKDKQQALTLAKRFAKDRLSDLCDCWNSRIFK